VLIAHGYTRAQTAGGDEWSFSPAFARLADLGTPREIVALYVELHGPAPGMAARYVLAVLCEQDDALPLLGCVELTDDGPAHRPGLMPEVEQVILAQHLMRHGIVGTQRPVGPAGEYAQEFDPAEYIAAARVHLGVSAAEAGAMSMSEFQSLMLVKFPEAAAAGPPSREEYEATMALLDGRRDG
jgi:hypothetical protein